MTNTIDELPVTGVARGEDARMVVAGATELLGRVVVGVGLVVVVVVAHSTLTGCPPMITSLSVETVSVPSTMLPTVRVAYTVEFAATVVEADTLLPILAAGPV